MKLLALIIAVLALAGCADDNTPVVVTAPPDIPKTLLKQVIPTGVLECLTEPDGSKVISIRQSATYILDLKKAGKDCRQKLSIVRNMIQNEQ